MIKREYVDAFILGNIIAFFLNIIMFYLVAYFMSIVLGREFSVLYGMVSPELYIGMQILMVSLIGLFLWLYKEEKEEKKS